MELSKKMENYFNAIYKQFEDKTLVFFCKREFKDLESVLIPEIEALENKKSNDDLIQDNRVTRMEFRDLFSVLDGHHYVLVMEIFIQKDWIKPEVGSGQ